MKGEIKIYTRCRNCFKKIPFRTTYCEKCLERVVKRKKDSITEKTLKSDKFLKTSKWQELRRKIILRDKGCCVLCFKNRRITKQRLQVHHIVKRIEDESLIFEPTNLVTVCKECHEILEKESVAKQKELLGEIKELETQYLL